MAGSGIVEARFAGGGGELIAVGAAFLFYAGAVSPWLFRRRVDSIWKRYPSAKAKNNQVFNDQGFIATDDAGNPSVTSWRRFIRADECALSYLLYLSPRLWIIVPKRLLEESQRASFKEFIVRKVTEAEQAREPHRT